MNEREIIYANGFRITMGLMEAQIVLKVDTPIISEEQSTINGVETKEVADVRLNPSLAKQLYMALKQHIDIYEQNFSSLNVPDIPETVSASLGKDNE